MSSRKSIWAGMDRLEGKKEGSSHEHLEKERVRQGYSKSKALHKAKEGVGQGTGTPKSKWGAKQGNWHKVMPGDR